MTMKKRRTVFLLAILVLLLVVAGILYGVLSRSVKPDASDRPTAPVQQPTTQPGEEHSQTEPPQEDVIPAPNFGAYDADGNRVQLTDYIGKPIVLNFWASWCGPCRKEMPHFEQAYRDMGQDVTFLMVNMTANGETQESAQSFLDDSGYTFPVLFDLDMEAAYNYGVYSLPMTVFIDENGNVQDLAIGAIDEATLLSKIDKIL